MPDQPLSPRHVLAGLRARLRKPSGPRSTLRVITLTHPMLDPGFAYWSTDDEHFDD